MSSISTPIERLAHILRLVLHKVAPGLYMHIVLVLCEINQKVEYDIPWIHGYKRDEVELLLSIQLPLLYRESYLERLSALRSYARVSIRDSCQLLWKHISPKHLDRLMAKTQYILNKT